MSEREQCKAERFGKRCKRGVFLDSDDEAHHEHYAGCDFGIMRWWDGDAGARINTKPGDGGTSLCLLREPYPDLEAGRSER